MSEVSKAIHNNYDYYWLWITHGITYDFYIFVFVNEKSCVCRSLRAYSNCWVVVQWSSNCPVECLRSQGLSPPTLAIVYWDFEKKKPCPTWRRDKSSGISSEEYFRETNGRRLSIYFQWYIPLDRDLLDSYEIHKIITPTVRIMVKLTCPRSHWLDSHYHTKDHYIKNPVQC